jgi:TRAP-type C4-dicarboxylate transport system substrate-binding protein
MLDGEVGQNSLYKLENQNLDGLVYWGNGFRDVQIIKSHLFSKV